MKNLVNSFIGGFFRKLGSILAILLILYAVSYFININDLKLSKFLPINFLRVNAATLNSMSSIDNRTTYIDSYDAFGSSGTYNYSDYEPNLSFQFLWSQGQVGTTYSGKAYALKFAFNYNLTSQKYYDVTINFKSRDLRSTVNLDNITLYSGSNLQGSNLSLIGLTNSASGSTNTNKLVVRIYATSAISTWGIGISSQSNITSVSNFGISSITIDEVDLSNTNQLLENATNNTTNIINNNNENTQNIIDNQNNLMGNDCTNLINFNNGNTYSITATSNDYFVVTDYLVYLEAGKTYYIKWSSNKPYADSSNSDSAEVYLIKDRQYNKFYHIKGKSYSINVNENGNYYVRFDCNKSGSTCTLYDLMISTSNKPYCKYGSFTSKLDDTTNSINDLNDTQKETNDKLDDIKDTLTDNSLNDSDIEDELNSLNNDMESFGFFSTFLTLPLTWVQNILSSGNSCRDLIVPLPFTNTNLTLPCMSDFWSRMGLLGNLIQAVWLAVVGVRIFNGLFLLTVDTISSKDNVDELTKIKSWEL